MIKLENLNFSFDKYSPFKKVIFENTSLAINGTKVLIQAPSGSGKSTLFNILMGQYKGYKIKSDIRILLQSIDSQILCDTVYDEINLGYKIKYKKDIEKDEVINLLHEFKLNKSLNDNPNKFSGGEKKILLFMALIVSKPDLLILDEPYVSLDDRHIKLLDEYLKVTEQKILMSTHIIYDDFFDQKLTISQQKIVGVYE